MSKKYLFRLYLSGRKSSSDKQITCLEKILKEKIKDQYSLEVIYVTESPEVAMHEDVICTPTLIRKQPLPTKRVIGDLTDKNKLLSVL